MWNIIYFIDTSDLIRYAEKISDARNNNDITYSTRNITQIKSHLPHINNLYGYFLMMI